MLRQSNGPRRKAVSRRRISFRGGVRDQWRRCGEATQGAPPEKVCLGNVVRSEPLDVIAVGVRWLAPWFLAAAERLVGGKELRDDPRRREYPTNKAW